MSEKNPPDQRRAPREPIEPEECDLSFIVEEDCLNVSEANLSATGIGFTTRNPLKIKLAMTFGEDNETREATLVWVKRNPDGTMNYGFEFS